MKEDDRHPGTTGRVSETDASKSLGLPWPESYQDLLPLIRKQWGVESSLYLNRKLSGGRSGAVVYAADIESRLFTGQAILKLDEAPDPSSQEKHEADLHHQAIADAPDFAAHHLPRLLHTLHHGQQIAVLSAIAGRGLQYATPWSDCSFEKQLEMASQVSRGLLEDWNASYRRLKGLRHPTELLHSWLDYRLDPDRGGRIHDFLASRCGIEPESPSITFEGQWYPNPLSFANGKVALPDHLRMRMISGRFHGDLHGQNILVGRPESPESDYYLIDLAFYQSEQFLFYDHAYFEVAFLLNSRRDTSEADWESILMQLGRDGLQTDKPGSRTEDIGLIELVRAFRHEVSAWIDRHEGDRLSYMESQYLLARVAAGLNFTHKNLPEAMKRRAFAYAAFNLKDYVTLNNLDWPKHGPPYTFEGAVPPVEPGTEAEPVVTDRPAAMAANPDIAADAEIRQTRGRLQPGSLFAELRRRHVVKIAGLYLIVAWLCVQVAGALKAPLLLPDWTDTLVTVLLALGFPIACIIAWAFELSPRGLQRTVPATDGGNSEPRQRDVLDYVVVSGIVALLAFTVWRYEFSTVSNAPTVAAGEAAEPSIAVLPFRNLSEEGSNDNFSDGLTIEIMATLARTGQFRLPGQSSTFRFKNQEEDLRKIGEDLGVQYLLEGSVRRVGNNLRVEAQLIEANNGFLVWSNAFADEIQDIFVIQEKIANAIGSALKMPLGIKASGLQTERTDSPEAYELFLNAIALVGNRGEHANSQVAMGIEWLRKAVEIDPDFAAGWAALSIAYDFGVIFPDDTRDRRASPAVYVRRASEAALKAHKLDPDLSVVAHAMANVHRRSRRWAAAEDLYRETLEQEPNNVLAMLDYARLLAMVGHEEQAIALTERVVEIDSHNPLIGFTRSLYELQEKPTKANLEKHLNDFGKQPNVAPFVLRSTMGYFFQSQQVDRLKDFLSSCEACDDSWREPALAMVEAVGSETPEAIYDTYQDARFMGYPFLQAIGGPDLVLRAFEHNTNSRTFIYQVYLVPWTELSLIGKTDRFRQMIEDIGLDDYWRDRGWPTRCRPLEGEDFECG
ncbi:MAG: hypothetical protein NXI27_27755 [Alphaproteobacteria bacterium]|nr:hypothetical protein [Alphaproteobacteria bacterium]